MVYIIILVPVEVHNSALGGMLSVFGNFEELSSGVEVGFQ